MHFFQGISGQYSVIYHLVSVFSLLLSRMSDYVHLQSSTGQSPIPSGASAGSNSQPVSESPIIAQPTRGQRVDVYQNTNTSDGESDSGNENRSRENCCDWRKFCLRMTECCLQIANLFCR